MRVKKIGVIFLCIFFSSSDKVNVNEATIVESEVFVYNLGTMFYIDKVLFTNRNSLPATTTTDVEETSLPTTEDSFTTASEAESVPIEMGEAMPDILVADEEAATTTAAKNVTVK